MPASFFMLSYCCHLQFLISTMSHSKLFAQFVITAVFIRDASYLTFKVDMNHYSVRRLHLFGKCWGFIPLVRVAMWQGGWCSWGVPLPEHIPTLLGLAQQWAYRCEAPDYTQIWVQREGGGGCFWDKCQGRQCHQGHVQPLMGTTGAQVSIS